MKYKLPLVSLILIIVVLSCEEEITIDLNSSTKSLVVEGYIQEGYPSYVYLTKSEGYFNVIDSNTLENLFVKNAQVYVEREDGVVHELTLIDNNFLDSTGLIDSIDINVSGLYIDLNFQENSFAQEGFNYKLKILWEGDTVESTTVIPPKYPIDSVWVSKMDSLSEDYKCYVWARVNDPDTLGNSITAHFKRISSSTWGSSDDFFIPCAISARSDQLVNGNSFNALFARSGRFTDEDGVFLPFYSDRIENGNIVKKDVIILRLCHVSQEVYRFWRDAERSEEGNSNPFSEPKNLPSNIIGGLGVWGGYGTSYYKIPIVKDTVIYTPIAVSIFDMF